MATTRTRPRSCRSRLVRAATAVLLLSGCGMAADDASPQASQGPGARRGAAPVPVTGSSADDALGTFPLAAGWRTGAFPDSDGTGLTMPIDHLRVDFAADTCGRPAPSPAAADRLRAQLSTLAAYRTRELVVLPDADAAADWAHRLRTFYEACPVEHRDGLVRPVAVLGTVAGDQSFGVVRGTQRDGEAAVGVSALLVVRVGRSVLLDGISDEGWVPDLRADGRRVLDALRDDAVEVLAGQCVFTEVGC